MRTIRRSGGDRRRGPRPTAPDAASPAPLRCVRPSGGSGPEARRRPVASGAGPGRPEPAIVGPADGPAVDPADRPEDPCRRRRRPATPVPSGRPTVAGRRPVATAPASCADPAPTVVTRRSSDRRSRARREREARRQAKTDEAQTDLARPGAAGRGRRRVAGPRRRSRPGYVYVQYRFHQVTKVTVRPSEGGAGRGAVQRAADRLGLPGRVHPGRRRRLRQRGHRRRPAERRREDRPRRAGHRPGQRAVHPPGHHGHGGRRHQRDRHVQPHQRHLRQRARPARPDHRGQLRHPHRARGPARTSSASGVRSTPSAASTWTSPIRPGTPTPASTSPDRLPAR